MNLSPPLHALLASISILKFQAGRPALDWEFDIKTEQRRAEYFAALQQGFKMNFEPLEGLVRSALERAGYSTEAPLDEP